MHRVQGVQLQVHEHGGGGHKLATSGLIAAHIHLLQLQVAVPAVSASRVDAKLTLITSQNLALISVLYWLAGRCTIFLTAAVDASVKR